jgi:thiamine pyrophosphate-dependent acetolactate synthase large subunit-like protein
MKESKPESLELAPRDCAFLTEVAHQILGTAQVAGTTADACRARGLDVERIDKLIPGFSKAVRIDGLVFKKVEPDPEAPGNFGLFVRIRSKDG